MKGPRRGPLRIAFLLVVGLTGCDGGTNSGSRNLANDRIWIINEESELAARLHRRDESIPVEPLTPALGARALELRLVAEIDPPQIDGRTLQATSISRHRDHLIIGYNMAGTDHLGALEVISVVGPPRILALAVFDDTDVNGVDSRDGWVYAAEATRAGDFPDPAVLEVVKLVGKDLVLDENDRLALPSFAGTSVHTTDQLVFAASGDAGGMSVFDAATLELVASVELDDARWIESDDRYIVVVQGTPGRVAVFDAMSLAPLGTHSFPGALQPEAKSTVDLAGRKVVVAAGAQGAQILDVISGEILLNIPVPPAGGVSPEDAVTNAVTVDANLLFMSNGGAGITLVEFDQDLDSDTDGDDDTDSEDDTDAGRDMETDTDDDTDSNDLVIMGTSRLLLNASVNHATYQDRLLVVAAGLEGVKIIEIRDVP